MDQSREKRRSFMVTTRYADSRVSAPPLGSGLSSKMSESDLKAPTFNYEDTVANLNTYYMRVKRQILKHQSPTTGLFPVDLSEEKRKEAHVRDSVYAATATWALSQAYKRIDDDKGRTHELAQSAVKCMRGILGCWMRQADKVEKFKASQSPKNALHSMFNMVTGDPIDDGYEHLQIDCIALYLIFLVQMIQSGLQIIFTTDEVNFVQNLVFYVERAYRTPDYGMWERGSKYNNGSVELHASSIGMAKASQEALNGTNLFGNIGCNCSIGMAKAALESINGDNMYGVQGSAWSVIYVDIDAHNRNRTIFDTILPRESSSKNTDASLIPTISWPAFAIHEESLVQRTMDKIKRKLLGTHGIKRFLRDGFKTVLEDKNRKYYKSAEIKNFQGVECEWPMFIAYLVIDAVYKGDQEKVEFWQNELKPLLKDGKYGPIMPKYYYVPLDDLDTERSDPGSANRVPSEETDDNIFLWGQSVYIISQLLVEGLLNINELDPIRRYLPAAERPRPSTRYSSFQSSPTDLVIQVALIAESVRLQQMLGTYGIYTQTPHQIEPIQIWPPSELVKAYENLGVNSKMGMSGRPARPVGGLGTAKIYRACGYTFVCYPLLFEVSDFYLSKDILFVIDDVKSDLTFLSKCWKLAGRPTFCMVIREDNMRGPSARHMFELLAQFKRGDCDGIKVRLGRLQQFISSACIEHLDFLHLQSNADLQFRPFTELDVGRQFRSLTDIPKLSKPNDVETWVDYQELQQRATWDLQQLLMESDNMYCRAQILQVLLNREGLYHRVENQTVEERLEELTQHSGVSQQWAVVRFCSSLLGKMVDSLAPSITAALVRGKQITIGVFGREEEVIDKPIAPHDIKNMLYSKIYPYDVIQAVLQQELIINIGKFISTNPEYFTGILKIRIGWFVQAMKLELNYLDNEEDMCTNLNSMSPSNIKLLLQQVLFKKAPENDNRSVIWNRQLDGALNRVPHNFYDKVWDILEKTPAGLKVAGYHLPQQPTLSDMTRYELNFSLLVEQMLSKIVDPAYRQIIVESFMVVYTLLERNPELSFQKPVDMDKVVHEAFEEFQKDRSRLAEEEKQDNMNAFYNTPANVRHGSTSYIAKAVLNYLLDGDVRVLNELACVLS